MELKSVKRLTPTLVVSLVSLCWSGCALVNKMAANGIAGVMEATGDVWASGDDPPGAGPVFYVRKYVEGEQGTDEE